MLGWTPALGRNGSAISRNQAGNPGVSPVISRDHPACSGVGSVFPKRATPHPRKHSGNSWVGRVFPLVCGMRPGVGARPPRKHDLRLGKRRLFPGVARRDPVPRGHNPVAPNGNPAVRDQKQELRTDKLERNGRSSVPLIRVSPRSDNSSDRAKEPPAVSRSPSCWTMPPTSAARRS